MAGVRFAIGVGVFCGWWEPKACDYCVLELGGCVTHSCLRIYLERDRARGFELLGRWPALGLELLLLLSWLSSRDLSQFLLARYGELLCSGLFFFILCNLLVQFSI